MVGARVPGPPSITAQSERAAPVLRAALWVVAAAALALPVAYGLRVVTDVPLLDDWAFVNALRRYLAGEIGFLDYVFLRHNEHQVVPSRLAFLVAYHAVGLDLRWLRWSSIAMGTVVAGLATATLRRDLPRAGVPRVSRALLLLPCLGLPLSLAGWETIGLAMAFTNAVSLPFAVAALLQFDGWQVEPSRGRFALVCALAGGATLGIASGQLLWLLFAAAATWRFRFAQRRIETSLLWAAGVACLAMQAKVPTTAPTPGTIDPVQVAAGMAALAGVPVAWPGRTGTMLATCAGVAAMATFVVASGRRLRGTDADRARLAKYLLLAAFGLAVVAVVSTARHRPSGGEFASSRHVPMVLTLLLGCHGWAAVAGVASLTVRRFAAAGAAVLLALTTVADVVEYRMWQGRASAFAAMRRTLIADDPGSLPAAVWRERFYLDPALAGEVAAAVAFLRRERLSLFR